MASVSDVLENIGQDFLECGICMERYTKPKILDCVHSFCEKCLVIYYGNDEVKSCPVCRQETRLPVPGGISALKTNGFLITLRDKIELQEKVANTSDKARSTCELCTENEVTHHCLNCSQNICQSCMNIHQRSKVSADHTVGTLEDIRTGKVTLPEVQKENTCNTHKGEVNRFYCETCHVLICLACTAVDHCKPEHRFIDRAAASSKYKKVLQELIPTFTNEIEHFEGCLKDACTVRQDFEKNVTQTVQEVEKRADRLRAKVKAEEDRILGEIRVLNEDRNTAFEKHIQTMKSELQRKQHTLTVARGVTTTGSDSNFLSLFPIINKEMTVLKSYAQHEIDAKLHYLRLDQTRMPWSIGELDLGQWELGETDSELEFESVSDIAVLRGDKFAVTFQRRLVIFNTAGGIEQVIKTERSYYGIASIHNRLIVVGDNWYVQIYNEDFTTASQFRDVPERDRSMLSINRSRHAHSKEYHHNCICIKKDGTILVGHPGERLIHIIHSYEDPQSHTTRISLTKTPQFMAIDSNDRVLVTSYNDNEVTVIDDQGVTLLAIKPTIDGKPVRYCSGVCCDGSDIYVAVINSECLGQRYDDGGWVNRGSGFCRFYDDDEMNRGSGSGHIHRYDGDGKFLSCIVQGLHQPAGITLTEDGQHLAVVDDAKVKIYHKV